MLIKKNRIYSINLLKYVLRIAHYCHVRKIFCYFTALLRFEVILAKLFPKYFSIDQISFLFSADSNKHFNNFCAFAHFDASGNVHPYIFDYLQIIKDQGFAVGFCSTSPSLTDADKCKLKTICELIIIRENSGWDFGSWHTIFRVLANRKVQFSNALIVNDSVYGPISNMKSIFEAIKQSSADVIGLTDSYQISHHLQSYFLYFKNTALQSKPWRKYIAKYRYNLQKNDIIYEYEVGLSKKLKHLGFKIVALYDYNKLDKINLHHAIEKNLICNPTIYLWDELIEQNGFPFIKRELLVKDPLNTLRFNDWRRLIRTKNPFLIQHIETHLKNRLLQ